ncbi:hypothetical protein H4217_000411 [Coemansia sp. RSA 1939]|nr:hypothetical protein H4217_000411 [Coemansia sp. RSA 1939]KAJ2618186.1 hypothetical protein EV177_000143 [Coemansia sp. RSA 1804]KAJ2695286.1 hypothetical protein GGH99_000208 [Coemansia sp. RSA 1285]
MKKYFSRRLFVIGFPTAVTHGELTTRFEEYAFIDFSTSNEATLARGKINNTKIRGYALEVHFDNKIPQQFYDLLDTRYSNEVGDESPGYSPPRSRHNEGQDDRSGGNRTGRYSGDQGGRLPAGSGYKDYDRVDDSNANDGARRNEDAERMDNEYSAQYKYPRRPSPVNYSDDRRPAYPASSSRRPRHYQQPFPSRRPGHHPYGPPRDRRQHRQRLSRSPPPPPPPFMPPPASQHRYRDTDDQNYQRREYRDDYNDYNDDDRSSRSYYSDADMPDDNRNQSMRRTHSYGREDADMPEDRPQRSESYDRHDDNSYSRSPSPRSHSDAYTPPGNQGSRSARESPSSVDKQRENNSSNSTDNTGNTSGNPAGFSEDALFSGP